MEDPSHLSTITSPEEITFGRVGPVVGDDGSGRLFPDQLGIPEMSRRYVQDHHFLLDRKVLRRVSHPVEKWAPNTFCLLAVQPLEHHGNRDGVTGIKTNLLAPVAIEQVVAVETNDPSRQLAESGIRPGFDCSENSAEIIGQLPRPECDSGDDAQTAPAPAFESPEQIRIRAGIGDPRRAIGCDHLGFQQSSRSQAIVF